VDEVDSEVEDEVVDGVDLEVVTVEEEEGLDLGNPLSELENVHSERAADVIGKEVEEGMKGKSGVDSRAEATGKVEVVDSKGRRGVDSQVVVDEVEVEEGVGSVVEVGGVDSVEEDVEVGVEEDLVDVEVIVETGEVVETDIKSPHFTLHVPIPIVKIRRYQ